MKATLNKAVTNEAANTNEVSTAAVTTNASAARIILETINTNTAAGTDTTSNTTTAGVEDDAAITLIELNQGTSPGKAEYERLITLGNAKFNGTELQFDQICDTVGAKIENLHSQGIEKKLSSLFIQYLQTAKVPPAHFLYNRVIMRNQRAWTLKIATDLILLYITYKFELTHASLPKDKSVLRRSTDCGFEIHLLRLYFFSSHIVSPLMELKEQDYEQMVRLTMPELWKKMGEVNLSGWLTTEQLKFEKEGSYSTTKINEENWKELYEPLLIILGELHKDIFPKEEVESGQVLSKKPKSKRGGMANFKGKRKKRRLDESEEEAEDSDEDE
ncbi:unknown protein [Seminavis robusta]|uniref:Uncharacterized protein n=1 Tax=Seminavis robusta TaxID=568900 RepID=A0A9N8DYB3_9STRA|nr:unknown protein [Seminavis robusta]|eukprot:Sro387_g132220.1 n/a (331) ;mRNA; r:68089-69081